MGDLAAPAPRVNGELLSRFIGRKVLLLGKAESLENGVMQLRTSDNRLVRVALKGNAANYTSDFVEFEAIVDSADGVNEVEHSNFGSAFGAPRPAWRKRACRQNACPLLLRAAVIAASRSGPCGIAPRTLTHGPCWRADLANYNDLVLLIHGKAQTLFF